MTRLLSILAIAALSSLSDADFTVNFNSADHCVGSIIGRLEGTTGTGCQTTYGNDSDSTSPVTASSGGNNVVIHPSDITNKTGVAFYGEANCNVLIALGNVETCLGVGAYMSFQIIDITDQDLDWNKLKPASVSSSPPKATVTMIPGKMLTKSTASTLSVNTDTVPTTAELSLSVGKEPTSSSSVSSGTTTKNSTSATTGTTAAGMRRKGGAGQRAPLTLKIDQALVEQMANGRRMEHGTIRQTSGQVYKYQQISARAWRGISLHKWDDTLHTRNEKDLTARAQGRTKYGHFSQKPLSALDSHVIPTATCNLIRSCMVDSGDDPNFSIDQFGSSLLSSIHTLNPAADDWTWLEAPLVVEIIDSKGKISGYIYAHTLEHWSAVNTCSDQGTERGALQAALAQGADGTSVTDMRVELKVMGGTGMKNSLIVSTRSASNTGRRIHPICEAVQFNY